MEANLCHSSDVEWASLRAASPFSVVLCDPPWSHYGSPTKWAAAAKFYSLIEDDDLKMFPMRDILGRKAVVFMWCTSSSLARSIDVLRAWNLYYRGVAFVWCKTRLNGAPIGAQGVRPSITKPLTEFVIVGSTQERGRPLPLASEAIQQTVFAPKGRHSEKPEAVQDAIDVMYPEMRKAELFARRVRSGWHCWGNDPSLCQHENQAA